MIFKIDYLARSNIKSVLYLYFLFIIPVLANDFYPINLKPANGDVYSSNTMVLPIEFDICLGYDFPAFANEWVYKVVITNSSGDTVYAVERGGFDANGPACYPITDMPNFEPPKGDTYTLIVKINYSQDIDRENDILESEFVVKSVRDLALLKLISPIPDGDYFMGSKFVPVVLLKNVGDVPVAANEYSLYLEFNKNSSYFVRGMKNGVIVNIGEEKEVIILNSVFESILYEEDINKTIKYRVIIDHYVEEDNPSNDTLHSTITVLPNPIWPNEFSAQTSSGNLAKTSSNDEFIEVIVNNYYKNSELFNISIYDSTGHNIENISLDQFTKGETVDSFTVYSFTFTGDVLPDNFGAFGLIYDSLAFSDHFYSWGGTINAVEGIWKDSSSTDIGIVPTSNSSISLTGQGTDFSAFTWELSDPTPGTFNNSQLVPVEIETSIPDQFSLSQNYPNPFNPSTTIKYSIPKQSNVILKVFDSLGSEVTTLVKTRQPAGNYEIDFIGSELTSGIYFYRLQADDYVETKKMIFIK